MKRTGGLWLVLLAMALAGFGPAEVSAGDLPDLIEQARRGNRIGHGGALPDGVMGEGSVSWKRKETEKKEATADGLTGRGTCGVIER